jgi:hypothetical protein
MHVVLTAAEAAELLNARQVAPAQWRARCPNHDDHGENLLIRDSEGTLVLRCKARCPFRELIFELRALLTQRPGGGS